MADLDAALMQEVLDVAQRGRKADVPKVLSLLKDWREAAFRPKGSGNTTFVWKRGAQDLILGPFLRIVGPAFWALERAASYRHC